MGNGISQPINIDRYAGYGGNDRDPYNQKTHTFYYSSNDLEEVVKRIEILACDRELTWWEIKDRANSKEKLVTAWWQNYYDRAQQRWIKDYHWR